MADIQKIKINDIIYNLKDAEARAAIEALPSPMVFKGTVGTGGTVTTLPTAAELALINETANGHTGATSLFTVNFVLGSSKILLNFVPLIRRVFCFDLITSV